MHVSIVKTHAQLGNYGSKTEQMTSGERISLGFIVEGFVCLSVSLWEMRSNFLPQIRAKRTEFH